MEQSFGKIKSLKDVTLEMIEKVFFMAMNEGWANGKILTKKIPSLPGYKGIPFITKCKQFKVLDAFTKVHTNGISSGFTTIWYVTMFKEIPVWTMSYGGSYPKEVIPFLKLALMENYSKNIFNGGRGLPEFVHKKYPKLTYNNCDEELCGFSHFSEFKGYECISDEYDEYVGHHHYQGISLI